uniref:Uncharacterized protein n=1 Tax=Peronospora matthiolae TaxID=2874970 RepID=A0AAV1UN14_9STRA
MKCTTFLVAAIALLGVVTSADQPVVKTSAEALEKVQASALPAGVTLTGTTEKIDPPASAAAVATKEADVRESKHVGKNNMDEKEDDDDKKEFFGGGLGGWGRPRWLGQLGRLGRLRTLPLRLYVRRDRRLGVPVGLLEHIWNLLVTLDANRAVKSGPSTSCRYLLQLFRN